MLIQQKQQQLILQQQRQSKVIVFGLGNPGPKYSRSRHNVGFMALEKLAAKKGLRLRKRCLHSYKWAVSKDLTLVEPLTYMNNSGIIFPSLVKDEEKIIVIVDNMDLPLGKIRIKKGGSAAGHNGLKSIISAIGPDFIRVYVGIGRPKEGVEVVDHVLSSFTEDEMSGLDSALDRASDAIDSLLNGEDYLAVVQRANSL